MTSPSLSESLPFVLEALNRGRTVSLGVVIDAPDHPALLGTRVAWDGERLHGELDDPDATAAIAEILREAPEGSTICNVAGTEIEMFVERFEPRIPLVIVGAGHIAQPLSQIADSLGFEVTVIDDRPTFARRDRFPQASRVIVGDFAEPFKGITVTPRTHVVLVTRGHRYDYDCLRELASMEEPPTYVGMIGSRRRVRATFEQLAADGIGAEWLAGVHAPVGLDIGAETPAEIAVAIAAEIVLRARGGSGEPLRDRTNVIRYVKSLA